MVMMDNIDVCILEILGRDSCARPNQISRGLAEKNIIRTPRSVLNRIKKLKKHGIIRGYTLRLNPTLFECKESNMILLKFMPLHYNTDIDKLDSYLNCSSFCFFATRIIGGAEGYDYAFHLACDTQQQFNLQLGSILNTFRNLIERHQVYRLSIRKEIPRLLHNTHGLEGFDILNSINKEAKYEQEYIQGLLRQISDDDARYYLARFS
jgi:DNA-binding Lrp family transcriptional regulator